MEKMASGVEPAAAPLPKGKGKGKGGSEGDGPKPKPKPKAAPREKKVWAKIVDDLIPEDDGPAEGFLDESSLPPLSEARRVWAECFEKGRPAWAAWARLPTGRAGLLKRSFGLGGLTFLPQAEEVATEFGPAMPTEERGSRLKAWLGGKVERGDGEAISVALVCASAEEVWEGGTSPDAKVKACRLQGLRLLLKALPKEQAVLLAVFITRPDHAGQGEVWREAVATLTAIWQEDSAAFVAAIGASLKDPLDQTRAKKEALQAILLAGCTSHEDLLELARPLAKSTEDPLVARLALRVWARVALSGEEVVPRASAVLLGEEAAALGDTEAAVDVLCHFARAGHAQAVDTIVASLTTLASTEPRSPVLPATGTGRLTILAASSPLASALGCNFRDVWGVAMVKSMLWALPVDERLAPLLAALLVARHKSWAVVEVVAQVAMARLTRGGCEEVVAAMVTLVKAYSSPQLVPGQRVLRFPFQYVPSWDLACATELNKRLEQAGLSLQQVPQESVVITDVYGITLQDEEIRNFIPITPDRFPVSVVFNGCAPAGSRGFCVRRCPQGYEELNGMYLRSGGENTYKQFLGAGVLRHQNGWELQATRPGGDSAFVARAVGLPAGSNPLDEVPAGRWTAQDAKGSLLEVVKVGGGERHFLGSLDYPTTMLTVLQALGKLAREGDEEAIDAAYIIQTAHLGTWACVAQALETLTVLAPVGNNYALQNACRFASHFDAGVREMALDLMLKCARPEDLGMVRELLVHDKGQHARVLSELEGKFAEVAAQGSA